MDLSEHRQIELDEADYCLNLAETSAGVSGRRCRLHLVRQ
jgi:hypothetical protein